MENQMIDKPVIEINLKDRLAGELKVFDPVAAGLQETKQAASALEVKDKNDMEGYSVVKAYRKKTIRKLIKTVDNKRKELKRFYLEAGRAIDARAKEITKQLIEVEQICIKKERVVEDEIKRIEEEHREKIKQRNFSLMKVGASFDPEMVSNLEDDEFENMLKIETERYSAEQEKIRVDKEKAEQAQKMLAEEKEKREKLEMKIKQEREEIAAERKALEDERKAADLKRQQWEEDRARNDNTINNVKNPSPLSVDSSQDNCDESLTTPEILEDLGSKTDEYVNYITKTYNTLELAWNRIMQLEQELCLVKVVDDSENGESYERN